MADLGAVGEGLVWLRARDVQHGANLVRCRSISRIVLLSGCLAPEDRPRDPGILALDSFEFVSGFGMPLVHSP